MKMIVLILSILFIMIIFSKSINTIFVKLKTFKKNFLLFLGTRKCIPISLVVIAFGTYIYEIANFTFSIDEEFVMTISQRFVLWITQGRSGIFLFDKLFLFNNKFTPSLCTFLAVCIVCITALYLCFYLNKLAKNKLSNISMILFSGIIISLPIVNPDYLSFSIYNVEVSLGILFACISVSIYFNNIIEICNNKTKIKYIMLNIFILSIALIIYQSLASVFITVFILSMIIYILYNEINLKKFSLYIVQGIFILSFAMILYAVINRIMLNIYNLESSYVESFIGWGKNGSYFEDFKMTIENIKNIIFGINFAETKLLLVYYLGLIPITLMIILKKRKAGLLIFMILCYSIAPFSLSVILASDVIPIRTLQAFPIWCGAIVLILDLLYTKKNQIHMGISFLIGIIVFYQVQISVNTYVGDHLRYEQDIMTSHSIMKDIQSDTYFVGDKPIVFIGSIPNNNTYVIKRETIGGSFYEWDGGNNSRIHSLLNYLGYNSPYPTSEQVRLAKENSYDMEIWPKENSIKEIEGIIIVKLSDMSANWDWVNGI